jgi:hypothetical protein
MRTIINKVRATRSRENKMGVACSSRGTEYKTTDNRIKETERKIKFGRPRRR